MSELIPIDTSYKGYLFRSRLEARWAVFFDKIGWEYLYEYEGFILPSGPYLPDFYFPELNIWAEVKPSTLSNDELLKCIELSSKMNSNDIGVDVILLEGLPNSKVYRTIIDGNTGINIAFVGKNECYYPFFSTDVYPKKSSFMDQTKVAILKANQARFEFEWKECNNG